MTASWLALTALPPLPNHTMYRYYPLTISCIIFTIVVCMMPISDPPLGDVPFMDKWTHLVLFGGIASASLFELTLNRKLYTSLRWLLPLLIALLGGLVELMQATLTTNRSGEWLDFVADVAGVMLLSPLAYAVCRIISRRLKKD